jgi:hypothetical protein
MSDKYSNYNDLSESKRSLYQLLLKYTKEYEQADISLLGAHALNLIKKIIYMLQTESEENYKNVVWLENKIDNQKMIIDSARIQISYLQNSVVSLAQRLNQVESIQKDIDKIKVEQEKNSKINKQIEDMVKKKSEERSQEITQQQKQNEKLKKDFLAFG